ncbi:serine/arginine repetitive matrix protein 1-like isoform X1 [Canis lupus familiaris]|uniref:serine/arginine repetitive matrix protein 1-like isoform X1 n=1 Tax=Canis lupus familiaris TaxID=9615 RepID=UPI0018F7D572|nr:serine/arginine repetitive matrix protein 1-like isoform X1 [Canis lupus familiaris]
MIGGAAALTRPSSEADGGLATQSPASSRRGLRVPTPHRRRRTAAAAAAQPSSCVRADLLPPQPQPQPPRTASAPTPRRRGLTPPRHPYLRLGSSRPCPSALPATKRGGGPNYESRQRPRDTPTPIPAAVFPGADGSRSSEARSNRKRLGLPAGSGRRRRSRRRSAAPPVTRWGRGGGASSRDSAAAGVVLAAVLRSRGASRLNRGPGPLPRCIQTYPTNKVIPVRPASVRRTIRPSGFFFRVVVALARADRDALSQSEVLTGLRAYCPSPPTGKLIP